MSTATAPGEEDENDWTYYRTGMRETPYEVVVKTDPRHIDGYREYRFRRLPDGRLVAPRCATWHAVSYLRDVFGFEVLTPGIAADQLLLSDFRV
ncbi:hypothetical protein [Natrarchaeobaculum sulfurireducens]|uniref:hypothetical protein n=1 Tax=Natrarchaeobaculum sulfurireducens TaxID=2044521 RepID=UPI000E3EAEC3|nr:hypothetical protein [Natrarchaeobaculum sulfurireducens]